MSEFSDFTDRELLIKLATDLCWLKKTVAGHLKEHFAIKLTVLAAAFSAIGSLVVALILAIR